MKKSIKLIAMITTTLLLVSCGMNKVEKKTTEIINNTNEKIVVSIGTYENGSTYYHLDINESIEIDSTNDRLTVLYPRKYWTLGKVILNENENISVEINPNNFYVENY